METVLDAQQGHSVGSHIVLKGRVFGIQLYLDEVVITRDPPLKKTWETVGEPRLLVIGSYRMGFNLTPDGTKAQLRVAIDYDLPTRGSRGCSVDSSRELTRGGALGKWCGTHRIPSQRKQHVPAKLN